LGKLQNEDAEITVSATIEVTVSCAECGEVLEGKVQQAERHYPFSRETDRIDVEVEPHQCKKSEKEGKLVLPVLA